jgi:hypothetical protein
LLGGNHADTFVKQFVEARLCVPVEGGVTLAHEALITQWNRLAKWMDGARDARLVVAELERAARFWRTDPEVASLIRGSRLERIEREVHSAEGEWLSDDAWAYLVESLRRARQRRRWMWNGLVLVSLAVFGGVLGQWWMNTRTTTARQERSLPTPMMNAESSAILETSAVPMMKDATAPETVARDEVLPAMSAKATVSEKRTPLRSVVPRAMVPVLVASSEPVVAPEVKAPETIPPITTVVPSATTSKPRKKSRFVPEEGL